MKKLLYIHFSLLTFLLSTFNFPSYSQGCLPEGIMFTTQEQIDNFQTNYPGCTEIEGSVEISGANITSLSGLNVVSSIGGDLNISANPGLVDFSGLDALKSINGSLDIMGNNLLESITGLDSLINLGGSIRIKNQFQLNDISALQGLIQIPGFLEIDSVGITSLHGLHNVTSIGGYLLLYQCHYIEYFGGLESLNFVGGDFDIYHNLLASDLSGLENLQIIEGKLKLRYNQFQTLAGLEGLHSVNGDVYIGYNYHLINLNALSNLIQVSGDLIIAYNEILMDISGIQNVLPDSLTYLNISYNQTLSACDVMSVCLYLAMNDNNFVIQVNDEGCNSPEEVEQHCLTGEDELQYKKNIIEIYPNPANKTISIISSSQQKIDQIKIFNQTGILTIEENNPDGRIDVSILKSGLYFVEIKTDAGIVRKKLIIE